MNALGAIVPILGVRDIASPLVAGVPDAPSGRLNDAAQVGVLHDDAREGAPGTAEVGGDVGVDAGDGAFADDIVALVLGVVAAVGGDVAVVGYSDVHALRASRSVDERTGPVCNGAGRSTYLKPGSGSLAENEIRGARNLALGVDFTAFICKKSVLVAEEADAVVALVRSLGRKSKCLAAFAIGVFEVEVIPGQLAYYC